MIFQKESQKPNKTSNLEVDPLSNTAARRYAVLASIKNIIEIHCSISEINEKLDKKFGYLIPCPSLDCLF